jgi:hypothetical protein
MKCVIPFLFTACLLNAHCNAQETNQAYEILKIKEQRTPLKTFADDKLVKNSIVKTVFNYTYSYNLKKDTVLYYDCSGKKSNNNNPILFILKPFGKLNKSKLLIIENKSLIDSLVLNFEDSSNAIEVNGRDTYFLNAPYYQELKNQLSINGNIADLVDFLDDHLGDYPYQLQYINALNSYKKYHTANYKIMSASIVTLREANDYLDKWKVNYGYNKSNVLNSISQISTEQEVRFEKKLISNQGSLYRYYEHRNIESRFEDQDSVSFDINKNTYTASLSHFQFGLIKQEISKLDRVLYKKTESKHLFLSKGEL